MKNLIKLEELGIFLLTAYLIYEMNYPVSWWWYLPLFLAPDIGMLGYLINTRVGAVTYNFFHHRGIASILMIIGWIWSIDILIFASLILFAHSAFDRMMGYGLKYPDSFKHTSIGNLG